MINTNIKIELLFKLDEVSNEAMAKQANEYYSRIYIFFNYANMHINVSNLDHYNIVVK